MWPDALLLIVSRRDVETGDITDILRSLSHLISATEIARLYRERVDISFEGYEDRRELWEIPEVRAFVHKVDDKFPYWLYFLDKKLGVSGVRGSGIYSQAEFSKLIRGSRALRAPPGASWATDWCNALRTS